MSDDFILENDKQNKNIRGVISIDNFPKNTKNL
jgi:hypothetical protein